MCKSHCSNNFSHCVRGELSNNIYFHLSNRVSVTNYSNQFCNSPLMKCTWWTTTNAWDGKQHATTCEMINMVLGDPERIPKPCKESALNLNLSYNPKKSFLWHVQWHYIKCSQLPKHDIMVYYNNKPSAVTNIKLNFFSNIGIGKSGICFPAEQGSSTYNIMYSHAYGSHKVIIFP